MNCASSQLSFLSLHQDINRDTFHLTSILLLLSPLSRLLILFSYGISKMPWLSHPSGILTHIKVP